MATIKSFTDLSQSKTLSKILPLESADMYWQSNLNSSDRQYLLDMGEEEYFDIEMNFEHYSIGDHDIPAWSLAALLSVLPDYTLQTNTDGMVFVVCDSKKPMISDAYDNPIDACVAMIEKLYEHKIL